MVRNMRPGQGTTMFHGQPVVGGTRRAISLQRWGLGCTEVPQLPFFHGDLGR